MLNLLKRVALTIVFILVLVRVLLVVLVPKANLVAEVEYTRVVLPPPAHLAEGQYPERIASIQVSNRGHLPCRNVTLNVPEAVAAMIKRKGRDTVVDKHPQRLMLGDLGPRQSLLVVAWLSSEADSALHAIAVSHKARPGMVIVKKASRRP